MKDCGLAAHDPAPFSRLWWLALRLFAIRDYLPKRSETRCPMRTFYYGFRFASTYPTQSIRPIRARNQVDAYCSYTQKRDPSGHPAVWQHRNVSIDRRIYFCRRWFIFVALLDIMFVRLFGGIPIDVNDENLPDMIVKIL